MARYTKITTEEEAERLRALGFDEESIELMRKGINISGIGPRSAAVEMPVGTKFKITRTSVGEVELPGDDGNMVLKKWLEFVTDKGFGIPIRNFRKFTSYEREEIAREKIDISDCVAIELPNDRRSADEFVAKNKNTTFEKIGQCQFGRFDQTRQLFKRVKE